jgi:hypothetical protein
MTERLEESIATIVAEDRKYDQKFFGRFTEDERREMNFSSPQLVNWEYEDIELLDGKHAKGSPEEIVYSADAGDYFMVKDNHVFGLSVLVCNASYEGIHKRVVIKDKPSLADLRNWRELARKLVT